MHGEDCSRRHLSHSHSNDCLFLMDLNGPKSYNLGERPFKFQVAWLQHMDFAKLVAEEWLYEGDLDAVL